MQIVRDTDQGLITLTPTDAAEQVFLKYVSETLQPDEEIVYKGRTVGPDERTTTLKFQLGGTPFIHTIGNFSQEEYRGGMEFILKPDTEEDREEIFDIRDMCYFGPGLKFLNIVEIDGGQAVVVTGGRCQLCQRPVITAIECHTEICNACAAQCDHNYGKETLVIGGPSNLSVGIGCTNCGRIKPPAEGEREKSVLENHFDVERKLGIQVIYKNGPPTTPAEEAKLERVLRGYQKAQQRQSQ